MTQPPIPPDQITQEMLPCRACGADCSVQSFSGPYIEGEMKVWLCAQSHLLGGECPDRQGYLSEEYWNTRPSSRQPEAGVQTAKDLCAVIRVWLDADDATHWGAFERALDFVIEHEALPAPQPRDDGAGQSNLQQFTETARRIEALASPPSARQDGPGVSDEPLFDRIGTALDRLDEAKKGWEAGERIDGEDAFCLLRLGTVRPLEEAARLLLARARSTPTLPDDVVRLVIAARIVAFNGYFDHVTDETARAAMKELDQATEAFASRVPWEDEPDE